MTSEARAAQRLYRLLRKYGLTIEEYDEIMERQDGGCAICHATPEEGSGRWERLHVDHDHATERVRGILCHNCNSGLGHFKDDPELLRAAIHYLLGEPLPAVEAAHVG